MFMPSSGRAAAITGSLPRPLPTSSEGREKRGSKGPSTKIMRTLFFLSDFFRSVIHVSGFL